jgi:hypothetical protein
MDKKEKHLAYLRTLVFQKKKTIRVYLPADRVEAIKDTANILFCNTTSCVDNR